MSKWWRVYKYELEIEDAQRLRLPSGARPLSVQTQNEVLCLWALVDITAPDVDRWVYVVGTGNPG